MQRLWLNTGYTEARTSSLRFSRMTRHLPQQLESTVYDAIVIGGGCNGTGEGRDLALRGASVLLLDKSDPNKATHHNSHLGHGGLRYLQHFELGLVKEARQELAHLMHIAPHLVRPLSMVVPVYEGDPYRPWMVKVGLMMYDWFCGLFSGKNTLPRHQRLSPQDLTQPSGSGNLPSLRAERQSGQRLLAGFKYYDTQIVYPSRLAIENIRDMVSQHSPDKPVHALGHTEVVALEEHPEFVTVTFKDQLDPNGKTYQVKARTVLNTTGAGVDKIIERTQSPHALSAPQMGPTKGTHIMVPNTLGLKDTVYAPATDGRPFFVIPYPLSSDPKTPSKYLLIGTTDDKTWDSPYPTAKEVDYLLASTRHVFPQATFTPDDVFWAYSGFRPLPASSKKAGAVTRRHVIQRQGASRIFHIIGGKLTTYRSLSQEVTDKVLALLKRTAPTSAALAFKPCTTATRPLPGGHGIHSLETYKAQEVPQATSAYGVSEPLVVELIHRYGARYREVLDLTRPDPADPVRGPHLLAPITQHPGAPPTILAQALHALRYEGAETLMDIMTVSLKLDQIPGAGLDGLLAVVNLLAQERAPFSDAEKQAELSQYRQFAAQNLQWQKTPAPTA